MADKHAVEIQKDEHTSVGCRFAKKVTLLNDSYYQNTSASSGYYFYGFTVPGSNPTQLAFKLMRETVLSGEVLFADGSSLYNHQWSANSMPSINYS